MNDHIEQRLEAVDTRLERIEGKLDSHLDRVSRLESDVSWLRGYSRIATTVFLAVIGALGTVLLNLVFPGVTK